VISEVSDRPLSIKFPLLRAQAAFVIKTANEQKEAKFNGDRESLISLITLTEKTPAGGLPAHTTESKVTTDTTITALEEQLLQDRKDSTTLWQLQDNRTDRIFVCVNDEPHLYQPLRKQEAYTGAIDEDIAVASDVDRRPTQVIVVHADGSRTFYTGMLWIQVHEQPPPS
jgi:hypothetical protein